MPNFIQPTPLQELGIDNLVKSAVDHCCNLSAKGLLTELHRDIVVIRQFLVEYLSSTLFVEFCRRFLADFHRPKKGLLARRPKGRPNSHCKAALEMIMDVEVSGMVCEGIILRYLTPIDARRIQGLKVLDRSGIGCERYDVASVKDFSLQNLTTFISPKICSDPDLWIIGSCCPHLQVLQIPGSSNVTDRGLSGLSPCTDLRVIDVCDCCVGSEGINKLLDVHKKLEEFNVVEYSSYYGSNSFVLWTRDVTQVCQSMKRFALQSDCVTDDDVDGLVKIFPNLTHLQITREFGGSLCILKNLINLTALEFFDAANFYIQDLMELLKMIGYRISALNMHSCSAVRITQRDLLSICEYCRNIKYLGFDYKHDTAAESLIIPSLEKLEVLKFTNTFDRYAVPTYLEFGAMPSLKFISLPLFPNLLDTISAIVSDNETFPNIKELRSPPIPKFYRDKINREAKDRNLDFLFECEYPH